MKNVNFWILQLSINLEGCGESTGFEDKSSFRVLTSTLFHHSNRSSFIQVTSEGRIDVKAGHSIVIHELKVPNVRKRRIFRNIRGSVINFIGFRIS